MFTSAAKSNESEQSPSLDLLRERIKTLLEQNSVSDVSSVSVVSFVGFSQNGSTTNVASIANTVIEKNVFEQSDNYELKNNHRQEKATLLISNENNYGLWMYCDKTKNIVYLLLDSMHGWETLLMLWDKDCNTADNTDGFQEWMWNQEHFYLRLLFFTFIVSHTVLLTLPVSKLDGNLVSLLRTVASLKRYILTQTSAYVNLCWQNLCIPSPYGTSVPGYSGRGGGQQGGVMAPGRCVPFVLFLFHEVQLPSSVNGDGTKADIGHEKAASGSIKRMKESLQARIRFLFRTCYLVQTNDVHAPFDGRFLFTLPPPSAQFFVHLITRGSIGNQLAADQPAATVLSKTLSAADSGSSNGKVDLESLLRRRRQDFRNIDNFEIKLLREFASGWIKWLATGFPRTFAKRNLTALELPTGSQWMSGAVALQELLFGQLAKEIMDRRSYSAVDDAFGRRLKDCVQVNNRFSASHCAQVLRKAVDFYSSELPTHYTRESHEHRFDRALQYYMAYARGPCTEDYAQKLRVECQNIWQSRSRNSEQSDYL